MSTDNGSRSTATLLRRPTAAATIAIVLGLIAGSFHITNNGIGWHLGAGRWIVSNLQVPQTDPFSFTAESAVWIDHEWMFQVVVAVVDGIGHGPLLVAFRALLVAGLSLLLLGLSLSGGLRPAAALVLTALCVYGAWIRFLLRPELLTLLIVPSVLWLFMHRDRRGAYPAMAALMALGANLHGGVLVTPPLIAGLLAAEVVRGRWRPRAGSPSLASGLAALGVVAAAPILNPYGWKLYTVPLHIAHLVGLPHIPNPEWISPTVHDVPILYGALALGVIVLAARERDPVRWLLFLMAAALALRNVRNVGLFFMLLPLALAPALAGLPVIGEFGSRRRSMILAVSLTALVAFSLVMSKDFVFGLGFARKFYPQRACDFLEDHDLLRGKLYNDVRFGGYLISRFYPPTKVFLDDRNEIHEPLLREIYGIFQSSDVAAWRRMLDRYGIDVALIRYNQSFRVVSPSGEQLGRRGFSPLWFPSSEWALLYWDDTAMVLAQRSTADPELVDRFEYRFIRPDDVENLERLVRTDPTVRGAVSAELARKLEDEPDCRRALDLAEMVMGAE